MMKKCEIDVVSGADGELVLWCDTCSDHIVVERSGSMSLAVIVDSSKGHKQVRKRARELARAYQD